MRAPDTHASDIPDGACDCHVHLFQPERFPYAATRSYTPPPASVSDLLGVQGALGLDRVVLVQPSVYGTDNRCLADGLAQLGPRARGVAVIGADTSEGELDGLGRVGVRAIRLNLESEGVFDPDLSWGRLSEVAKRVRGRGWHVQVATTLPVAAAIADRILGLSIPVVFDHFAGARPGSNTVQGDFERVLGLVRSGHAYVKLSGVYRLSSLEDYTDMAPLARALVEAAPDRMLWASDWPHTAPRQAGHAPADIDRFFEVDDAMVLALLPDWAPDPMTRHQIMVANPARLYAF